MEHPKSATSLGAGQLRRLGDWVWFSSSNFVTLVRVTRYLSRLPTSAPMVDWTRDHYLDAYGLDSGVERLDRHGSCHLRLSSPPDSAALPFTPHNTIRQGIFHQAHTTEARGLSLQVSCLGLRTPVVWCTSIARSPIQLCKPQPPSRLYNPSTPRDRDACILLMLPK